VLAHVVGGGTWDRGFHMPPVLQKLIDVVVAIALTCAVFFVIVVANSFLMARGNSWHGINMWYSFIGRPDILGTMTITALVCMGYVFWQQRRRPRG
jgi:hypothetical protein